MEGAAAKQRSILLTPPAYPASSLKAGKGRELKMRAISGPDFPADENFYWMFLSIKAELF